MLESFVIYATLSDSTAVHPKYITLAVQNQAHRCALLIIPDDASNFCLLSVSGFSQPCIWACQLH